MSNEKGIEALPIPRTSKEGQKPFIIIGDYLLFLHETPERKEEEKEIINFFYRHILDSLVYELYFEKRFQQDGIYSNLASLVEPYLKDISSLKSDDEKLKAIKEVYEKLKADKNIASAVDKLKSHSWVKAIEHGAKDEMTS